MAQAAVAGKTANNGIADSIDEFPTVPSTLTADIAATGLQIRPFEPEDFEAVRTLFVDGMQMYIDKMPKGSPMHGKISAYMAGACGGDMSSPEAVIDTFRGSGGEFWVAVDPAAPKTVLAMVALQLLPENRRIGELRRMSVGHKLAGTGMASLLIRVVEEAALAAGCSELVLTTGSFMTPAMKLYTRTGFELCRMGHPSGDLKAKLEAAGQYELLIEMAFRKPLTSNNGRWMWQPHTA
mmetsp:Transcript_31157/g.81698  ORF Transcript_31157/g.81698 Transcript_31157/m.81698 type:complete len:238 (-) Transcript_31157:297-1010(-)